MLWRFGIASVRTPTSAPFVWIRPGIGVLDVAAHGDAGTEVLRPLGAALDPKPDLRVREPIRLRGGRQHRAALDVELVHPHPIVGLEEAVVDPVVPDLQAEGGLDIVSRPATEDGVACVEAAGPAMVALLELIAASRIREEVGEVREQIEVVVEAVGHEPRLRLVVGAMPFPLHAVALRVAAVGRIERAEEADQRDRALRDLIARVPLAVIRPHRRTEAVPAIALAVGHEAVELAIVVGMHPWAVVVIRLPSDQHGAQPYIL